MTDYPGSTTALSLLDGKRIPLEAQKIGTADVFPVHLNISRLEQGEESLFIVMIEVIRESAVLISLDSQGFLKSCSKQVTIFYR